MMPDTRDKLQQIFRDLFDDDDIELTDTTAAADIPGWDSLKNVKLIVQIEKAFKVRFGTGEVVTLKNVGELVALIDRKVTVAATGR
jgi:acyl carrier protein